MEMVDPSWKWLQFMNSWIQIYFFLIYHSHNRNCNWKNHQFYGYLNYLNSKFVYIHNVQQTTINSKLNIYLELIPSEIGNWKAFHTILLFDYLNIQPTVLNSKQNDIFHIQYYKIYAIRWWLKSATMSVTYHKQIYNIKYTISCYIFSFNFK